MISLEEYSHLTDVNNCLSDAMSLLSKTQFGQSRTGKVAISWIQDIIRWVNDAKA